MELSGSLKMGLAFLIGLIVIWLIFSVFLANSWFGGIDGLDIVKPSCEPACSSDESCEFKQSGRHHLISALMDESVCKRPPTLTSSTSESY